MTDGVAARRPGTSTAAAGSAGRLIEAFCTRLEEDGVAFDQDSPRLHLALEVAALAAALARSDKVVLQQEREALLTCLVEHVKLEQAQAERLTDFVFELDERELPTEAGFLAELSAQSLSDRLLVLDGLFAVAAADHTLQPVEEHFLRQTATELGVQPAAFEELLRKWDVRRSVATLHLPLGTEPVTIGRAANSAVQLPGLSISAEHAVLEPRDGRWLLRDLGSASGTWVNEQKIDRRLITPDDQIRIENFSLRLNPEGTELLLWDSSRFTILSSENLGLDVRGRARGGRRKIVDDVSFSLVTGELVALMGPSGCGKTTLLSMLLGKLSATDGQVLLDGRPCPDLARRFTSRVGIVPQDDIVYSELTVEEALYYSGVLRSVPGVASAEVRQAVDRVVENLGLVRIRGERIGDPVRRGISGGERKRVNLGQELLSDATRFLILDEPTTGLDPHTGVEIFKLLRRLSDEGRLVLAVTHRVDEETIGLIDKVLILGGSGKLVYFGPPRGALSLFAVPSISELFLQLREPARVDHLAAQYRSSRFYEQYVQLPRVLSGAPPRSGTEPTTETPLARAARAPATAETMGAVIRVRQLVRQLTVLLRRGFRVKLRDRGGLAVALGQVPLIVFGCWLVLQNTLQTEGGELVLPGALPFILVVSAFWLGCASSVREIVGDQAILRRERLAGLGLSPYVVSKLGVLLALTSVQCILLVVSAELAFDLTARHVDLLRSTLILGLVGFFGTALGLCISASCRSSEAAVGALPGLVIPQLLFGGLLVPFSQMPRAMDSLSYLMASRWGMDGMLQSGSAGLDGNFVDRALATLFTVPGGRAVPRDWFLKMLGLAEQTSAGAPAQPLWAYGDAVLALSGLALIASFVVWIIVRIRHA